MRDVIVILCLLAATACAGSPTGPTVPLDTEFALAPGESRAIDGTTLTVRFNGVAGDSRCPADAICIQGGSAEVQITATSDESTMDHVLLTGDMRPVQHGPFTIALVQLALPLQLTHDSAGRLSRHPPRGAVTSMTCYRCGSSGLRSGGSC